MIPHGANLCDLRVAVGMSLRDAAELLHTSAVDLGRIERGRTPITADQFAELAHELLAPHRDRLRRRRLTLEEVQVDPSTLQRSVLASVGSSRLVAMAAEGRLDLTMEHDQRSIGLTLMFEELETFAAQVKSVLRTVGGK